MNKQLDIKGFNKYMTKNGLNLLVKYVKENESESLLEFDNPKQLASTCFFVAELFEKILDRTSKSSILLDNKSLCLDEDIINVVFLNLNAEAHAFVIIVNQGKVIIHNIYGGHLSYVVKVFDDKKEVQNLLDNISTKGVFKKLFGIKPIKHEVETKLIESTQRIYNLSSNFNYLNKSLRNY